MNGCRERCARARRSSKASSLQGGRPPLFSVHAWPSHQKSPLWTTKSGGLPPRSEEHTSELQSQSNLVCRLLLEKKKETRTEHVLPDGQDRVLARLVLALLRANAREQGRQSRVFTVVAVASGFPTQYSIGITALVDHG